MSHFARQEKSLRSLASRLVASHAVIINVIIALEFERADFCEHFGVSSKNSSSLLQEKLNKFFYIYIIFPARHVYERGGKKIPRRLCGAERGREGEGDRVSKRRASQLAHTSPA